MVKTDNVFLGKDARARLKIGIDKVANPVKGTLGSSGYNAILEDPRPPFTVVTNDGISVAKAIQLSDPVEQMGAHLVQEIGQKSDRDGGDGTSTSITLLQAILNEGEDLEASPMDIKRSLDECLPIILKSIDEQTRQITVDEVGAVATISAEDDKIGALIQEIYQKIGKDGILNTDISKTSGDHYLIGKGVKMEDGGLVSPYMADTEENGTFKKSIELRNPKILITTQRISAAKDLNDIVTSLYSAGTKELIVICDEIDPIAVQDLVMTRAKTGFRTIVIKLPVIFKDHWIEDISKMTGATIINKSNGIGLKEVKLSNLGTCDNVISNKTDTYFEGIQDLTDHLAELEKGEDEDKIRAARLNTKSARLYVGASSDSELTYKRLKLEDARNAAYQALHGGIVAGGGVALLVCASHLPDTIGGNLLKKALTAPIKQICLNAGFDPYQHPSKVIGMGSWGFNAKTSEIVDMFEAGIVDPANVVKNAITNAISVAGIVLTTQVIVTRPNEDVVAGQGQMLTM